MSAVRSQCVEDCEVQQFEAEEELEGCLENCRVKAAQLADKDERCHRQCAKKEEPMKTFDEIEEDHEHCEQQCWPPHSVVSTIFFVGGIGVFVVIGIVLVGRFFTRPCSQTAGGLWAWYAWLFFLLAIALFAYVQSEATEEVKVKLTFVLSVVLSTICTGLAELRESMGDKKRLAE